MSNTSKSHLVLIHVRFNMLYLHIREGDEAVFPWEIPNPVKGIGMKVIYKLGPVVRNI